MGMPGFGGLVNFGPNQGGMVGMGGKNNNFMYGMKKGKVEDNDGDTEDNDCV